MKAIGASCDHSRLEIACVGIKIGCMFTRLSRVLILLAAAGVAYAGPVSACLCVAEPADQMPCCPDDTQQQDRSGCPQTDSEAAVACDTVPADLLPAGTQDVSPPVAVSATLPPWPAHGLPASSLTTSPPFHDTPPIYLITLRLRI